MFPELFNKIKFSSLSAAVVRHHDRQNVNSQPGKPEWKTWAFPTFLHFLSSCWPRGRNSPYFLSFCSQCTFSLRPQRPTCWWRGYLGGGAKKKEYPRLNDSVEAQSWTHRSPETTGLWIMNVSVVVLSSQKPPPPPSRPPSHHHHHCQQVEFQERHCFELPKKNKKTNPSIFSLALPRLCLRPIQLLFSSLVVSCVGRNPKSLLAAPRHQLRRSREGPQASLKRSEPDLLAVQLALTRSPLVRAKKCDPRSVALMFCYASLILKNNDGAGGTLGGSNLGGLFFFPAISSQSQSFSLLGTNTLQATGSPEGKRLRLPQGRRRNRPSLGSSRTAGPLAVFRRGGGREWGSVFAPLTHTGWQECFEIWWLRCQAQNMWRLFEPVSNQNTLGGWW